MPKAHAHEKVGVIMKRDGKVGVVEYSEIDKDTEEATVSALAVAKQARGVAYLRS